VQLFGQFAQQFDAKHRLTLPPALRRAIGEAELKAGLILTRGLDGCLWAFPASGWGAATAELCRSTFGSRDARTLERLFLGGAVQVPVDRQGRLEVPDALRERAGINGEVLLVGVGARIELWAPARWQAVESEAGDRYEELAEATAR